MSAQHTPGPWTRNRHDDIHDANGDLVCGACGPEAADQEANARLIAAAPDLLAALSAAFIHERPSSPATKPAWWDLAAAAIAKAEGRS